MNKLVIFFLTSFFSFELWACKGIIISLGDQNNLEYMSKFLNEAQNIYFGTIVNDGREFRRKPIQVFKVKKIWKSDKPGINAQEWFKREMQILNKRYGENDFVSSVTGGFCMNYNLKREQEPNKYYLYIGNNSVQYTIPIEKAKPLIVKLKELETGNVINPSLQFCESDSQCVKVNSKCSNSVNKEYANQLNALLKMNDNLCKTSKTVTSKCIEWFCE